MAGRLPHLEELLESGGYARLEVANPPQSEVSWTSLASGLNPGEFGLFDFVHRSPQSYTVFPSLLTTARHWFGTRFEPPHRAYTLFDHVVDRGFPAVRLWWPATFPPDQASPVRTLTGLGTPDVFGRLGAGVFLGIEAPGDPSDFKTRLGSLDHAGRDRYRGVLPGPWKKTGTDPMASEIEVELEVHGETQARLRVGEVRLDLPAETWSPILELRFPMRFGAVVHTVTRAIVRLAGCPGVYFLPLQIHPARPVWPVAGPSSFGREIWRRHGPFLSLGWPQDTTGLEEGFLTSDQFLHLCELIFEFRRRLLLAELDRFDDGVLGAVFDSLDRIQHMFWRDRQDIVADWYRKYDSLVGELRPRLARRRGTRLLVMSDHGFNDFDTKVDVNRWLLEQGDLVAETAGAGSLRQVDWDHTSAYSLGLNSLYLNQQGREGRGCIAPDRRQPLLEGLRRRLLDWVDPTGRRVLSSVWLSEETFRGRHVDRGPDMVLGFGPGFRASAENGLGEWSADALRPNHDRWSGDHCIDPQWVPGVLFSSEPLWDCPSPSYRDVPQLAVGLTPDAERGGVPPSPELTHEDRETLEARLRELGYL